MAVYLGLVRWWLCCSASTSPSPAKLYETCTGQEVTERNSRHTPRLLSYGHSYQEGAALLEQRQELYIPQDERTLRRVQRRVDELDRRVRGWAQSVIDVLPKGLAILEDETYILSLYLAQQRRLNLEMDAQNREETLRDRLGRVFPFLSGGEDDWEMVQAVHHLVASQLESDIERACAFFCRDRNIPPICDPSIAWRGVHLLKVPPVRPHPRR